MESQTDGSWLDENEDPLSDEELVRRFCDHGDREAFTQIVQRYEHELHVHLWKILKNNEMVEDVFQEACIRLFKHAHQFTQGSAFRTWFFSIARNAAFDYLRRNKRFQHLSLQGIMKSEDGEEFGNELENSSAGPFKTLEVREICEWIRAELARLSDDLHDAVYLVYFEGYTYPEAGKALGIPEGTVKSRVHRAIGKMYPDHPTSIAS